jgi:ribosomal protein S18 acetylase RimI-like enzyme
VAAPGGQAAPTDVSVSDPARPSDQANTTKAPSYTAPKAPPYTAPVVPAIRAGTSKDVDAVLDLWLAADVEPTHTDNAVSLAALVAHDPGALLVALDGDRVVGSVIAGWDGWRGTVYRLAVAPAHRRSGVARTLVHAAEARLTDVGAVRMQTIVVESSPGATAFWRASGWEEQAERLRFVKG